MRRNTYLALIMGCRKLSYYQSVKGEAKEKTPSFLQVVWRKNEKPVKKFYNYYAGGSQMPGRNFNPSDYRFGWNTQEKVDEISGVGNHYTAKYWEYDPRIIRRWNRDPVPSADESEYAVNKNNPILYNDPDGDVPIPLILRGLGGLAAAAVEAGVQFGIEFSKEGATFTSALKKLDAADIGIAFGEGFATTGGNIPKILARRAIVVGVGEAAKASVDLTVEEGVEVVGVNKGIGKSLGDLGAGLLGVKGAGKILSKAEKGIAKDISSGAFSTLTKGEQQLLRNVQNVVKSKQLQTGVGAAMDFGIGGFKESINFGSGTFTPGSFDKPLAPSDATGVAPFIIPQFSAPAKEER